MYYNDSTFIMDNFRNTKGYNTPNFKNIRSGLDKGHKEQFRRYVSHIKNGLDPIISFSEIINSTQASFAALDSLKQSKWIDI